MHFFYARNLLFSTIVAAISTYSDNAERMVIQKRFFLGSQDQIYNPELYYDAFVDLWQKTHENSSEKPKQQLVHKPDKHSANLADFVAYNEVNTIIHKWLASNY